MTLKGAAPPWGSRLLLEPGVQKQEDGQMVAWGEPQCGLDMISSDGGSAFVVGLTPQCSCPCQAQSTIRVRSCGFSSFPAFILKQP